MMWIELNGSLINLSNVIRIDKKQCMNQFALEFYYEQDKYTRVTYKTEGMRDEELVTLKKIVNAQEIKQ